VSLDAAATTIDPDIDAVFAESAYTAAFAGRDEYTVRRRGNVEAAC